MGDGVFDPYLDKDDSNHGDTETQRSEDVSRGGAAARNTVSCRIQKFHRPSSDKYGVLVDSQNIQMVLDCLDKAYGQVYSFEIKDDSHYRRHLRFVDQQGPTGKVYNVSFGQYLEVDQNGEFTGGIIDQHEYHLVVSESDAEGVDDA